MRPGLANRVMVAASFDRVTEHDRTRMAFELLCDRRNLWM
jgi:hypothetical protein